ncbi:MAG TPA: hypothetical protein VM324_04000 [Egibacteraceae bacterium]|jgi:hypothetical protein|nr:hypothetical protein [Egibacteraceae bacterium]
MGAYSVAEAPPFVPRWAGARTARVVEGLPGPVNRLARGRSRAHPAWRWVLLAAYAAQLVVVAVRHEPWFDEAQAWLLARDLSLWDLLAGQLRYEGTPGLWHLLLLPLAKLGAPYASMQALAVAVALGGAYVLVRHGPFPLPVTALLLFSFVIGYQYAVVARSYVLLPLLLFLLARVWPDRATRVTRLTVLLVLLANVSVHGLLIAGTLAALHLWERWRERHHMHPALARRHVQAAAGLAALGALLVAQLWPPPDLLIGGDTNLDVVTWLPTGARVYNSALTGSFLFSGLAVAMSGWWFHRAGTLALWVLPTAALLGLSVVKYHNYWHDGVPFLVWVFVYWVSLERWPADDLTRRWARLVGLAALSGVLVVHAVWWANSASHDVVRPYSASPAAAAYLADERLVDGTVWATGFHAFGIQPYFDRNIFDNYAAGDAAYWHWSDPPLLEESRRAILDAQPDTIVWGVKFPRQRRIPNIRGYEVAAAFDGDVFWKNRVVERDAFVILRRTADR